MESKLEILTSHVSSVKESFKRLFFLKSERECLVTFKENRFPMHY